MESVGEKVVEATKAKDESRLPFVGSPSTSPLAFTPILLEKLDEFLFRGPRQTLWRPFGARGVFGGQIMGQSLHAAIKTVSQDKHIHSIHSYFIRRGDETTDIIYTVLPLRDGRSFSTRLVTAQQQGKAIFVLIASFHRAQITDFEHQHSMPVVPSPASLPTEGEFLTALMNDPRCPKEHRGYFKGRALRAEEESLFDIRRVVAADCFPGLKLPEGYTLPEYPKITDAYEQIYWMKTKKRLPDDTTTHFAVLTYASDLGLLSTAKGSLPVPAIGMVASLDHSMWFHTTNFRMDEWLLFVLESPRQANERGLSFGKIFTADGTLAVTIGQEGLIRLRKDMAAKL